ncbi:hypothetical protein IRT38_11035, partial [Acinetobacter sp. SK-43]|nr:hypothetical protein [Acinetobacter sp. SK-43]
ISICLNYSVTILFNFLSPILNKGITGQVHQDRKLLTGDSPLASNNLGKLAAETLLADPSLNA